MITTKVFCNICRKDITQEKRVRYLMAGDLNDPTQQVIFHFCEEHHVIVAQRLTDAYEEAVKEESKDAS